MVQNLGPEQTEVRKISRHSPEVLAIGSKPGSASRKYKPPPGISTRRSTLITTDDIKMLLEHRGRPRGIVLDNSTKPILHSKIMNISLRRISCHLSLPSTYEGYFISHFIKNFTLSQTLTSCFYKKLHHGFLCLEVSFGFESNCFLSKGHTLSELTKTSYLYKLTTRGSKSREQRGSRKGSVSSTIGSLTSDNSEKESRRVRSTSPIRNQT